MILRSLEIFSRDILAKDPDRKMIGNLARRSEQTENEATPTFGSTTKLQHILVQDLLQIGTSACNARPYI